MGAGTEMNGKLPLIPFKKQNPPARGGILSGSPWAPISVCPTPFQEQLGPSSGRPKSPGFTIPLIHDYSRLFTIVNNPAIVDKSGSPWALISIFPAAFQRKLGHSPSDRGHQALRYRSTFIVAQCRSKSTEKTSGTDKSHSVFGRPEGGLFVTI